ncbi:MAG: hypothetical protein ACYC7G_10470, partial [Rudaea sp.]
REGAAQNASGKIDAAYKNYGAAQAVFEKLRAAGDRGEATTYGLALSLYYHGQNVVGGGQGRGTALELQQAADLLRPLVYAPGASRRVRQLYAGDLDYLSHTQPLETGVKTCDEGRKVLTGLGALDLSDLDAASEYADTADSEARHLTALGRIDQAQQLEQQTSEIAEKVLARRPGDLHAMADRVWAATLLGAIAARRHDLNAAADFAQRATRAGEDEVRFNPSDLGAWWRWTLGLQQQGSVEYDRGEVAQAIATMQGLLALKKDPRLPGSLGPVVWYQWIALARYQALTGDAAAAAQSLKGYEHDKSEYVAGFAAADPRRALLVQGGKSLSALLQLIAGHAQAALDDAIAASDAVSAVQYAQADVNSKWMQQRLLDANLRVAAAAAIRLGRAPQAEALARRWLAVPQDPTNAGDPRSRQSAAQVVVAHALVLQGRLDEARSTLQPALAWYREQQQAGATETDFRHDFAYALYVSAIAAPADMAGQKQRRSDLDEAGKLIAGASVEAQKLVDMRYVTGLIAAAMHGNAVESGAHSD